MKIVTKTLSAVKAAALDTQLMSTQGGFSVYQLMELAGLSVAQAVWKYDPTLVNKKVLVLAGPGNNGGDGLVAARHLWHLGARPIVYYPKQSKGPLFEGLVQQLNNLDIEFITSEQALCVNFNIASHVIDAIFGFSFKPPIREPFFKAIELLKCTQIPVTSVDIPSGWHVDNGPIDEIPFHPSVLVSLTAPKHAARFLSPKTHHFLGGRFVSNKLAAEYDLNLPEYPGLDHVVEIEVSSILKYH